MNKTGKIISFFVIILVTIAMGYISLVGIGEDKKGSLYDIKQGLDLAGGVSITYEVVGEEEPTVEEINDTVFKLQQKVDTYSTEAQVYPEGTDRINIEIPGVNNANEILEELGKPGSLVFLSETDAEGNLNYEPAMTPEGYLVYHDETWNTFVFVADNIAVEYDTETNSFVLDENGNAVTYELAEDAKIDVQYKLNKPFEELLADGSVILTGEEVQSAKAAQQQNQLGNMEYVVSLSFNATGTQKFAQATEKAYTKGETIAIYYDDKFISVPTVGVIIRDGQAVINGMTNADEAERLASNIRNGALKLELQELRSNVVGAQLGSEAITTCLQAAVIGFILVGVFMIAVYFMPGATSVLALVLYVFLMIITLSLFNEVITLTLPGIAGIILSIGMAVDANVIIFARIREELATGKTVQSAVDIGFKKATSSIVDGNVTTLIASVVLIIAGTGTVKGFAWTLAIGIVLSMFTAMVITRFLLNGLIAMGLENIKLFGIGKERKTIDFLSKGKVFLAISALCILIGGVFMGIHGANNGSALNLSLEFMGGTSTSLVLAEDMSIEEIDAEIVPGIEKITGDGNVQVQKVEGGNEIIIKTRELNEEERQELESLFTEGYGVDANTIQSQTIGATISGEMKSESLIAVSIAIVCMLIYIWLRFSDWRFGVSSVAALLHDVLVVLAFYAVSRVSVGSTFIACMLTIVGYSINATIVIFDRIRENYKDAKIKADEAYLKKRQRDKSQSEIDLKEIVNRSITQTLSRSLFTSMTTFIMVAALYILGVTSIKEFALPLMIGIVCGAYSSVCLAGSLWYFLRNKFPVREGEEDEDYV
ncbi:MAG: protein translocase subunit SecD [Lachnospiraceae bacterium]|nr:protein translocase subunit SecD [Lachnospiraceae bacterium]